MKKVLENKSCSKPPKTALTDYLAHPDIEKILREVLAKLTLYIAEVRNVFLLWVPVDLNLTG